MSTRPFALRALALALFLLASSVVFAAKVRSEHAEEVDFSTFETYAWRVIEDSPTSPGLDRDVQGAVDEVLAKKGLRMVAQGETADLRLEYAVGSVDHLMAGGFRMRQGWWGYMYLVPGAYSTVEAGILILATPTNGDEAVWGGAVVMRGNTPNALQVMRDRAGREAKRIAKTFPDTN